MNQRPTFKYHPNYYRLSDPAPEKSVCQCCGREVDVYENGLYSDEDVECVCLDFVSNGAAAKKFNGEFNSVDPDEQPNDPARTDEILHRTPSFDSWQDYSWPTCCDDYCAFLGHYADEPVKKLRISDDAYEAFDGDSLSADDLAYVKETGDGLVFQCLHCRKFYLIPDYD